MTGTLYLVPVPLGAVAPADCLPASVIAQASRLDCWIAENARSARRFLVQLPLERPVQEMEIREIDARTPPGDIEAMLAPLLAGRDAGLVSEAGCPGVADPGAPLVAAAHRAGIPVVPLVGPSSLLLTLMGSGLNGQRFAFKGYLPARADERADAIRRLERRSAEDDETQLWIETPYRAQAMLATLLETCHPDTRLALGCDLTLPTQSLAMKPIHAWRAAPPALDGRLVVFALLGATGAIASSTRSVPPAPRAPAPRAPAPTPAADRGRPSPGRRRPR